MRTLSGPAGYVVALGLLLYPTAGATLIPTLSFEQLTDASDLIVAGHIANSWVAWDREHKYIWTHYTIAVTSAVKGGAASVVEFAEPGGVLEDRSMVIAGSVSYAVGDRMLIFLERMPNGYLRTTGWAQGKYSLDTGGRLHSHAVLSSKPASSVRTLDGMTLAELTRRVAARGKVR
jgi:hypothetical protein